MDLLGTLRAGATARSGPSGIERPASWLVDLLTGGQETYSGKAVSPSSALSLIPVYSAVTLLSGAVGSLPLVVYKRLDPEGRERATTHRTWKMLHDAPNSLMAADEYWEIVTAHLLLWGEHFSAKGRGPDGMVNELVPLKPNEVGVRPELDRRGQMVYEWQGRLAGADEILHIRGLGTDGRRGLSPIALARQALGNSLALEEFQGRFWANNARPGGILKHPGELSDKGRKRLKASWENVQGGLANAGKTAVLEEGMEWQQLGLPLADAQFIEQQKFGRSEIALLFRVPPHMLAADTGDSMTYANVESHSLDFVKWSLRRWLKRIEGSLLRDPDIFRQGDRFYAEFLIDGLLRGDSKTRAEVYRAALDPKTGWLDVDEVREMENRNPFTPAQLRRRKEAAKAAAPAPQQQPASQPEDQSTGDDGEETT